MWYESLDKGKSWASLWHGYIRCYCGGIRRHDGLCGACGERLTSGEPTMIRMPDGSQQQIAETYMGGEARYEDWVYLIMLQREWLRPVTDEDRFLDISETSRPAARAIVVLVFWTYFETRIARLLHESLKRLPPPMTKDLLRRYNSIGSRLYELYRLTFGLNYFEDLRDLGYAETGALLTRVHDCRNKFSHGHPEAIDEDLTRDLVVGLKNEHESWIAAFNKRISSPLATTQ